MNTMPNDMVYAIAMELEYDDIIALCKSEVIYDICSDRVFWMDTLRYHNIPFSKDYNIEQLKILYKYTIIAKKRGQSHVTFKVKNLNDIVPYLPQHIITILGPIQYSSTHTHTPFVKIVFWKNGTYSVNIFNKSLKVGNLSQQEALQLVEDLNHVTKI